MENYETYIILWTHWRRTAWHTVGALSIDLSQIFSKMLIPFEGGRTSLPSLGYQPCMRSWARHSIFLIKNILSYNTVLLTIVTMFNTKSRNLMHLINKSLYLFNQTLFPTLQPPAPENHFSILCFWHVFILLLILDFTHKRYHAVSVFHCLAYFTKHHALKFHPHCHKWQNFLLSHDWLVSYHIYVPHLLCPFICWQTLRLFPYLCYYE